VLRPEGSSRVAAEEIDEPEPDAPVSGPRPQASFRAGSRRKASMSSQSSYPAAITSMRASDMSA
jgi:hypothetical protein